MDKKHLIKLYYDIPFKYFPGEFVFPCRNIVFELTYDCNLKCVMCAFINEMKERPKEGGEFIPLTTKEVINLLKDLPKSSNIVFTGGEIFIRKDIMEILRNAASRHKVTIATNGILLTDAICAELVRIGIMTVGSSLDGPRHIHNSIRNNPEAFDRAIKTLERIDYYKKKYSKKFPYLNVNCVILKENYLYLANLINEIKDININSVSFQVLDPSFDRSGWRLQGQVVTQQDRSNKFDLIPEEELKNSLNKTFSMAKKRKLKIQFSPQMNIDEVLNYYQNRLDLSKWQCSIPWTTLRISPYGDVFPCLNYKIGNIREKNLQALWNSARYRMMRKQLRGEKIFPACLGCCKMERRS